MKPEEKKIKTSIYLPSETHWALKEEAVKRRMSDTSAMQEAIERWISGEPTAAAVAHPADRWHNMLADILNSGDKEAISAVTQNLRVFYRVKKQLVTR